MRPPPPLRAVWRPLSFSDRQLTLKRTSGCASPVMRPSEV